MKNMRIACLAAAACVSVSCLNGVFAVQAASSVLPAEPQTEEQPLTDEILLPQELAQSQQDADNVRKDGTETEGAENAAASAKPADAEAPGGWGCCGSSRRGTSGDREGKDCGYGGGKAKSLAGRGF